MIELHFYAVEGAGVPNVSASRLERIEYVGQRWDPKKGALEPTGEPARVVLHGPHESADRAYYVKALREGHLRPADEATAAALGVPFEAARQAAAAAPQAQPATTTAEGASAAFDPDEPAPGDPPRAEKGRR